MKKFKCNQCGACCSNLDENQVVLLLRKDIESLSKSMKILMTEFTSDFCELNHDLSKMCDLEIYQLNSLDGKCVFLMSNNLCGVHDYKPFQCKNGPERFLKQSMTRDYECMRDLEPIDNNDLTEYFFLKLQSGK